MEEFLRNQEQLALGLSKYNLINFQAQIAAHLGDIDRALELMEKTILNIDPADFYWMEYPYFEPLWGNPIYEQWRQPKG